MNKESGVIINTPIKDKAIPFCLSDKFIFSFSLFFTMFSQRDINTTRNNKK